MSENYFAMHWIKVLINALTNPIFFILSTAFFVFYTLPNNVIELTGSLKWFLWVGFPVTIIFIISFRIYIWKIKELKRKKLPKDYKFQQNIFVKLKPNEIPKWLSTLNKINTITGMIAIFFILFIDIFSIITIAIDLLNILEI